ncbi:MAG: hypothetical protein OCD01_06915 [Fibrobacterales bacterium]
MRTISIANIEDGMILQEPVIGNSGQIILSQGATLTKSLARRLESRGILQVTVEGNDATPPKSDSKTTPEHSNRDYLIKKFSNRTDSLTMNTLYAAVEQHILRNEEGENNE